MAAGHSIDGARWRAMFEQATAWIAVRFSRVEPRATVRAYLLGLLSRVERKNCWQLAEQAGLTRPGPMQRLLRYARWDADAVRDDIRAYAVDHLGADSAVLIVDETGFVKKGRAAAGVQRQYTGTAGRIACAHVVAGAHRPGAGNEAVAAYRRALDTGGGKARHRVEAAEGLARYRPVRHVARQALRTVLGDPAAPPWPASRPRRPSSPSVRRPKPISACSGWPDSPVSRRRRGPAYRTYSRRICAAQTGVDAPASPGPTHGPRHRPLDVPPPTGHSSPCAVMCTSE
ncbi:transposase [Streptomyces sp. NPDC048521]|uniref:transposase n=1 Tax=Streptomyces sp. NPDC048521 TaxID=3365566 RepID=UPI003719377B